jgi:hypothetical protein
LGHFNKGYSNWVGLTATMYESKFETGLAMLTEIADTLRNWSRSRLTVSWRKYSR